MLLGMLPLLSSHLASPTFHRIAATDASDIGAGVVTCPLSVINHGSNNSTHPDLLAWLWPLCASRDGAMSMLALQASSGCANLHKAVFATRWSTIISKRWNHEQHINVLELRAVLLLLHWLMSYPSVLSSRVFCLVDSSVAFFTLWKGRSSSPQLLFVLRKISALLLASDITLLCGWIPSVVNPADHPSRSC